MANFLTAMIRKKRVDEHEQIALQNADLEFWKNPLVAQCEMQSSLGRRKIQTTFDDQDQARALMDRVIGQWKALSEEPYWCNDTSEQHKLENLDDQVLDDFYACGTDYMRIIEAFESRSGVKIRDGVCVELGAGVGRHTHALARRFSKVYAVDVSPSLLEVSDARNRKLGITNVITHTLLSPNDLGQFGPIDFFMGQSVLQCNPPPIQRAMIESLMQNLKPGGIALFDAPDWLEGYTFSTKSFMETGPNTAVDTHCFPKSDMLKLIRDQGAELLDFTPEFTAECFGAYSYFVRKSPLG